ncbi:hypothetical protein N7478_007149 [Penicillium angulare]|uniref:uncharacterized protein n=1 Tax=Penicillium angulare TaxID=116970 RepID=UPI002541B99E|nr:uncharacterized protein N7478_007149 [Penicillium angulare]KAJ5281777.1 hypothetical protein N7478_007149 [Penicillium angulare]
MKRRSLSPREHPTAVRYRSRSPMQQDSRNRGSLAAKSRAELVQSIQAEKAVAESLEALAQQARHEQWALERELSDLDKMDDDEP